MSHVPDAWDRPTLRLFTEETFLASVAAEFPAGDGRRLSPSMTLRQFFEIWFLPIVLEDEGEARPATIRQYLDALDWWERLTDNPPLRLIDEFTVRKLNKGFESATYRRGKLGKERPLSLATKAKHRTQLNAILARIGPQVHPEKKAKALVAETPRMKLKRPAHQPKECFSLDRGRRVMAVALDRPGLAHVPGLQLSEYLELWLSLLYFTGGRAEIEVPQLEYSMLQEDRRGWWLNVPGKIRKNGKPLQVPVGPHLLDVIERTRRERRYICPLNWSYSWQSKQHARLQLDAGIPRTEVLSPHAWRRTHGDQVFSLGAAAGMKAAKEALDHADERTTELFYVANHKLIRQLPPLRAAKKVDDRQGRLF